MAITVKDIQDKEFEIKTGSGYDMDQVDDFLDEISQQMAALVRENVELTRRVQSLDEELQAAKQAAADAEAKTPDYNEKGYFQNLQNAMRESLIGAQRIADETLDEANQKAAKTVSDAQAQADSVTAAAQRKADNILSRAQAEAEKITGDARGQLELLQTRFETLKTTAAAYKADYTKLLEKVNGVLAESKDLF